MNRSDSRSFTGTRANHNAEPSQWTTERPPLLVTPQAGLPFTPTHGDAFQQSFARQLTETQLLLGR